MEFLPDVFDLDWILRYFWLLSVVRQKVKILSKRLLRPSKVEVFPRVSERKQQIQTSSIYGLKNLFTNILLIIDRRARIENSTSCEKHSNFQVTKKLFTKICST